MGPARSARTLLKLDQADGFDCMSCAWPDPDVGHRHTAEFCENGAKAVAEEATKARATPDFFASAQHRRAGRASPSTGSASRAGSPTRWSRGRARTHYEPISWEAAFALIADQLNALASPNEAIFYTSGRTSNEAAFAYQLFVRAFGTNNLPDCSNMCHESTSVALAQTIGIGKAQRDAGGRVRGRPADRGRPEPRHQSPADAVARWRPPSARGAKIIAINPLREAGLINFRNPQAPRGLVGRGTDLADLHLPIKINGDLALFQAFGALLVEWGALDPDFVDTYTRGFAEWRDHCHGTRLGPGDRGDRAHREQITARPGCCGNPTAPSSAGRWA